MEFIRVHNNIIPCYDPPEGYEDDKDYLRKVAYVGLKERYGEITPEISKRADYELDVICRMGFASDYLIVWDIVNYGKTHGIPIGPGRGSSTGSIIAYALRITEIDPLRFSLIFDRFFNPGRLSMLGFDIEVCPDRREEIIGYVHEKYSGTMNKKTAMRGRDGSGLLRVDFLANKTLSVIDRCRKLIKKNHGIEIDFDKIGYGDQEIYKMLASGDCDAVFQLNSKGIEDYMKRLKPSNIEEIIAVVSLYRPRTIQWIDMYINNKRHKEKLHYRYLKLEPILKETYGVIIYQEQVMAIAQVLAGYTMTQADDFRESLIKKKEEQLFEHKKRFFDGCISNGVFEDVVLDIWEDLKEYGAYAFNKAHAAAYSILTYQTAYLKCHYPLEFLCTIQNN